MTTIDTAALRHLAEHGFIPNPATILALLDALDAVTAERDQLREAAQTVVGLARRYGNFVPPTWDKPTNEFIDAALALARLLEGEQP